MRVKLVKGILEAWDLILKVGKIVVGSSDLGVQCVVLIDKVTEIVLDCGDGGVDGVDGVNGISKFLVEVVQVVLSICQVGTNNCGISAGLVQVCDGLVINGKGVVVG